MQFAIVDIETLKEIDPQWEYRRKSNDGTQAIIHKEILDTLRPQVNNIMLDDAPYPFPLIEGDELDNMKEFKPINNEILAIHE